LRFSRDIMLCRKAGPALGIWFGYGDKLDLVWVL
jgi:hypothetical protein